MSPHQIIAVAARLFAVWLIIHLPGQIYAFFDSYLKLHDTNLRYFAAGIGLVELALILVLWLFPYTIAHPAQILTRRATPADFR